MYSSNYSMNKCTLFKVIFHLPGVLFVCQVLSVRVLHYYWFVGLLKRRKIDALGAFEEMATADSSALPSASVCANC